MKKFNLIFVFFLSFFAIVFTVDAGVCDGRPSVGDYTYCRLENAYNYYDTDLSPSYQNRYFNVEFKYENHYVKGEKTNNTGLLGYAYDVYADSTISKSNEPTFCLDNGLIDPKESGKVYNLARELNINIDDEEEYSYDKNIYKVYQKYVNDVGASKNAHTYTDAKKYELLSMADVMMRMYTIRAGYNVSLEDISDGYGKERSEFLYDHIYPYITSGEELTLLSDSEDPNNVKRESTWGKKNKIAQAKTYFENTEDFNLWKNPLKITADETCNDIECTFNFKVDFKSSDGRYVYFGDLHDLTIGFGNAYFNFLGIQINDKDLSEYSALRDGYDMSSPTTICAYGCELEGELNESQTFFITMTRETYNKLKAEVGDINVSMIYKTYHPMSEENVFINKSSSTSAQRMVVFTKYDKEKKFSLKTEIENNYCAQEGNLFTYDGNTVGLAEYATKCGCATIRLNEVTDTSVLDLYNRYCPFEEKEEAKSNLGECEGTTTDYDIEYIKKSVINRYCNLTCTEDFKVKNLVAGTYTVKAGMYFEFDKYPELISTKKCEVNINKTLWNTQYEYELKKLASAYNTWGYYSHNDTTTTITCSACCAWNEEGGCSRRCYWDGTRHSTSYNSTRYNNELLEFNGIRNGSFRYCYGDYHASRISASRASYLNQFNVVKNLLDELEMCNNTIINMGEDEDEFYQLQKDLNFYYSQTYSKDNVKVWNNNKPNYEVNVDDSDFKIADEVYEDKRVANDYTPYISNSYTNDVGMDGEGKTISIIDQGNILNQYVREVNVKTEYSPSVPKYREPFYGNISSAPTGSSSVWLGYVYDTDISAVAKSEKNYYRFFTLGSLNESGNDGVVSEQLKEQGEEASLRRYCEYEIINEPLETCKGSSCDTKINVAYRIVDPINIDPNNRLGTDKGFKNWLTPEAKAVMNKIQSDANGNNTYNPDNLEYSFELNSKTIKEIRSYNEDQQINKGYGDFMLDCNAEGNKCTSEFISQAFNNTNTHLFSESFATNINGRDTWKVYENNVTGCSIDGESVECP